MTLLCVIGCDHVGQICYAGVIYHSSDGHAGTSSEYDCEKACCGYLSAAYESTSEYGNGSENGNGNGRADAMDQHAMGRESAHAEAKERV